MSREERKQYHLKCSLNQRRQKKNECQKEETKNRNNEQKTARNIIGGNPTITFANLNMNCENTDNVRLIKHTRKTQLYAVCRKPTLSSQNDEK